MRDIVHSPTIADRRFDYFMFAVALCVASLSRKESICILQSGAFVSRALLDGRVAWMQEASQSVHMNRLGDFVQSLLARHDVNGGPQVNFVMHMVSL